MVDLVIMETGQGIVGAQRRESPMAPGTQESSPGRCGPGQGPQVGTVHLGVGGLWDDPNLPWS